MKVLNSRNFIFTICKSARVGKFCKVLREFLLSEIVPFGMQHIILVP
jgi:hypothetical protein